MKEPVHSEVHAVQGVAVDCFQFLAEVGGGDDGDVVAAGKELAPEGKCYAQPQTDADLFIIVNQHFLRCV